MGQIKVGELRKCTYLMWDAPRKPHVKKIETDQIREGREVTTKKGVLGRV